MLSFASFTALFVFLFISFIASSIFVFVFLFISFFAVVIAFLIDASAKSIFVFIENVDKAICKDNKVLVLSIFELMLSFASFTTLFVFLFILSLAAFVLSIISFFASSIFSFISSFALFRLSIISTFATVIFSITSSLESLINFDKISFTSLIVSSNSFVFCNKVASFAFLFSSSSFATYSFI